MMQKKHSEYVEAGRTTQRLAVAAISTLAIAALAACQPAKPSVDAAPAAEPPAVEVTRAVQIALETAPVHIARVEASQRVLVRPRVTGHIDAVLFKEGEVVRAGQPLFRIDHRPFEASVARANAELRLAKAQENLAGSEANRARELAASSAISAEELERRLATYAESQARRGAAEASLRIAELDREFTLIRAPITGRIGRALVTAGNFVSVSSDQTPLASIVSIAPLHVYFDISDRGELEKVTESRGGASRQVRILDIDGQKELARAVVDFSDNEMVTTTGTLRMRARIDSPHPKLLPGMFVRTQLVAGHSAQALLIPDKAIGTDQGHRFALVVTPESKVEYRPIQISGTHGDLRIVTKGIHAGEQVVSSGLMRVRPGMTVTPKPAEAGASVVQGKTPHSS